MTLILSSTLCLVWLPDRAMYVHLVGRSVQSRGIDLGTRTASALDRVRMY